jgi:hypothetical protein
MNRIGQIIPRDRKSLCLHEASHALCCHRYAKPIGKLGVWIDGCLGGVDTRPIATPSQARRFRGNGEWAAWKRRAEAEIISLMVGDLAELRYFRWPMDMPIGPADGDPINDLARAERILRVMVGRGDHGALERRLQRRAARILCHAKAWRAVCAVARALTAKRVLSGAEALTIFRRHNAPVAKPLRSPQ